MQLIKHFFVIVLLLFLLSCTGESPATDTEMAVTEEHHAAVMKTSQAYFDAIKAVDAEKVVSFWTEDPKIIQRSGEDIVGKEAFKNFLGSFYPTLKVFKVEISRNEVDATPTYATQTVRFSEELSMNGGNRQTIQGRYFAVWKNLPDHGWKIHRMVTLPLVDDTVHTSPVEE